MWYPHAAADEDFVHMAVNVARAICRASAALRRRNPATRFVHVDTCEHHQALDRKSEPWVRFANERRFLMHDLVLGRMRTEHPLWPYLQAHGCTEADRQWLAEHRAPIDVLGLDYYQHSEMNWYWNAQRRRADIRFPCLQPRGFAAVAQDYVNRFHLPVMLSETNLRGTVFDRLTWLRHMEEQCEELMRNGVDLRGFCWYPSIDSTDWCHCCTKCTYSVDPQGIWYLDDRRWHRHPSELSECYAGLARGERDWCELPAYRFAAPLDRDLHGFLRLMRHWNHWQEQAWPERAA